MKVRLCLFSTLFFFSSSLLSQPQNLVICYPSCPGQQKDAFATAPVSEPAQVLISTAAQLISSFLATRNEPSNANGIFEVSPEQKTRWMLEERAPKGKTPKQIEDEVNAEYQKEIEKRKIEASKSEKELRSYFKAQEAQTKGAIAAQKESNARLVQRLADFDARLARADAREGRYGAYRLLTDSCSPNSEIVKNLISKSLLLGRAGSKKANAVDNAELALASAQLADQHFASAEVIGAGSSRRAERLLLMTRGQRYLDRAQSLYAAGNQGGEFGNFEMTELLKVDQAIERLGPVGYEEFAATVGLRLQAEISAHEAERATFISDIDALWAMVDYLNGLSSGVADFVVDTATGLLQLVSHPIDTTMAVVSALFNYERTFEYIYSNIQEILYEYRSYSPEQKGNLHARIATEILATLLPVGDAKKLADISKLEHAVVGLTGETVEVFIKQWRQATEPTTHAIEWAKQGKHLIGHNSYDASIGRSVLTHRDPQKLINDFAGKGEGVRGTRGDPGFVERVEFHEKIGEWRSEKDIGKSAVTTVGTIHYSRKGVHIVPARPKP